MLFKWLCLSLEKTEDAPAPAPEVPAPAPEAPAAEAPAPAPAPEEKTEAPPAEGNYTWTFRPAVDYTLTPIFKK